MTSFLEVIASDESDHRRLARKAAVLSKTRVDSMFGQFITAHGETALDYLDEQLKGVVEAACEEVGYDDPAATLATVVQSIKSDPPVGDDEEDESEEEEEGNGVRQASVHESRKPKMCPFHKDVVDISLAAGDARAGFDSMAQHWGGPRHCEGDGYEGGKCNFKAPMTTQSYWDEKAEKAEERRRERAEQAELEAQTPEVVDEAPEATEEIAPEIENAPESEGAEIIEFPTEPSAVGEGIGDDFGPEPVAVAASTKTADDTTGLGGPSPKIDKRKWTPQTVKELPLEGEDSRNPTKRKDVIEPITADNESELSEIGENKTEHQDVSEDTGPDAQPAGTWTEGPKTAVSSHDPEKNELVEIMKSNYDGFVPQHEVQQAVVAYKRR